MFMRDLTKPLLMSLISCAVLCLCIHPQSLSAQEAADGAAEGGKSVPVMVRGKSGPWGTYWIGIMPRPIDKEVAEKFNVKVGSGVVVAQVMPGSPAAKAGLAKGDIILSVVGEKISHIKELAEAVLKSGGKTLNLQIQRAGKKQEIEITPVKSGQAAWMKTRSGSRLMAARSKASKEKLEGLLRQLEERQKQMRESRAGAAVASQVQPWQRLVPSSPSLPDDMEVSIKKRGKQPARVTVKQGQKMWKTTENELEMLPPGAQAYVARMLGRPMTRSFSAVQIPEGAQRAQIQRANAQRIQVRIGEDGQPHVVQPARAKSATIKALPGAGIRIEVKENEKPQRKKSAKSSDK